MSTSLRANLAYGYDLGGPGATGWKLAEASATPGTHDIHDLISSRLKAAIPEKDRAALKGFFAEERYFGVSLEFAGYTDDAEDERFTLVARDSCTSTDSGDKSFIIDMSAVSTDALIAQWDATLATVLTVTGLIPTQPSPRWLLFPYYSGY